MSRWVSLWRCPSCLVAGQPAFSLHMADANLVKCPNCGRQMVARRAYRHFARIRKVAIIRNGEKAVLLVSTLNSQLAKKQEPNILGALNQISGQYTLLARPEEL